MDGARKDGRASAPEAAQKIRVDPEKIAAFCRRSHIRKLAFFGSVLREDFGPESDVDVLVEFERDRVPGFFGLGGMQIELSELLGRKADIKTPQDLSPYFRDKVVAGAAVQYERG